ncbi:MAG: hypothetical protein E2P02_17525 [Acidobacteria bacterium]|nr:MAG: hypothetical protein E2P02_17525 [Acidobacteriota bacterium]
MAGKRWVLGLAAVFLLSGPVWAQSLGEVARKERQRRADSASETDVVVIREQELEASEGKGLTVTGRSVGAVSAVSGASAEAKVDTSLPGPPASSRLGAAEVRELRETWSRVWKEQLQAAEGELEIAKDHVFQCRAASHYFFVPIAVDCDGVHERLAIAEYRLDEIRENQYNWELLLPQQPDEASSLVPEQPRR